MAKNQMSNLNDEGVVVEELMKKRLGFLPMVLIGAGATALGYFGIRELIKKFRGSNENYEYVEDDELTIEEPEVKDTKKNK